MTCPTSTHTNPNKQQMFINILKWRKDWGLHSGPFYCFRKFHIIPDHTYMLLLCAVFTHNNLSTRSLLITSMTSKKAYPPNLGGASRPLRPPRSNECSVRPPSLSWIVQESGHAAREYYLIGDGREISLISLRGGFLIGWTALWTDQRWGERLLLPWFLIRHAPHFWFVSFLIRQRGAQAQMSALYQGTRKI